MKKNKNTPVEEEIEETVETPEEPKDLSWFCAGLKAVSIALIAAGAFHFGYKEGKVDGVNAFTSTKDYKDDMARAEDFNQIYTEVAEHGYVIVRVPEDYFIESPWLRDVSRLRFRLNKDRNVMEAGNVKDIPKERFLTLSETPVSRYKKTIEMSSYQTWIQDGKDRESSWLKPRPGSIVIQ